MLSEYLRLAVATALVLLPGALVARALGQRSVAAVLAWTLAAVFVAWAVVFLVHGDVRLAIALLAAVALAAGALAVRRGTGGGLAREEGAVVVGGVVLGLLLWHVAGVISGDGLFHLGRVRKLVELGGLHLGTVNEFADGGLHPGYAFPLWHAFLALVAKLSGLDPAVVVNHEASVLAVLACALAWEAGVAVFRSRAAGASVLLASVALYCLAAGGGGSWATMALPGTASRQLLVPAAIALFFTSVEGRRAADAAALAAVFGALALVHPTYALFLLVPLAGYALVRVGEWRASAVALGAAALPMLAAFLWLRPIVDTTVSHDPAPVERARALRHYADQIAVSSPDRYHLRAEVLGRSGAVAVAALVLVPLAGFAIRRRWAALVLGGSLAVLALMLVPELFTRLSDRRLDLAVAARSGVRAVRVRARGRVRAADALAAAAAGGARRGRAAAVALAGGLRVRTARGRARGGHVDRVRGKRRSARARARPAAARAARAARARGARRRAVRRPDRRARGDALGRARASRPARALPAARA